MVVSRAGNMGSFFLAREWMQLLVICITVHFVYLGHLRFKGLLGIFFYCFKKFANCLLGKTSFCVFVCLKYFT